MTRKQAIEKIVIAYRTQNVSIITQEVIDKLVEMSHELPMSKWTKTSVFDTIDQYLIDNKFKSISTADFDRSDNALPSHVVIKKIFHMSMPEFLQTYYKDVHRGRFSRSKFRFIDKKTLLSQFIKEVKTKNINSLVDYDKRKNPDSPSFFVLKKWAGFTREELSLIIAKNKAEMRRSEIKTSSHHPHSADLFDDEQIKIILDIIN